MTGSLHEEHLWRWFCGAQQSSWMVPCVEVGSREEGCESGGFHCLEHINIWSSPLQFPGFLEKNGRLFHLKCLLLCVHAAV